jgi:hypothetical protein
MKVCPNCQNKYPDDGNFCPREDCATADGPSRLVALPVEAPTTERFALGESLGGGASGEVWRAHDAQTGEEVAYKLISARSLPTPLAVDRAVRELKQLARVQSPRIARVVDSGTTADGRLFVASELCAGEPLDRLADRIGPFPLDRAKKIIAQIGEALLDGQKAGVVHRDLAPKNVLVVEATDEVKVINFVAPRAVADSVLGVPEYLAPEQAEGKLADQRSNTYSLGAILTMLLTGQPPILGATPQAVLDQVIRGDLPPPSRRRPNLTPEIDRVIMKALDKSSTRRPLTMRQFLNDVAAMQLQPSASAGVPGVVAAQPFAKTMLFAGNSPEIRKLVAEATAARDAANGAAAAASAQAAPAASVVPAAVAIAVAAAGPVTPPLDPGPTPPPRMSDVVPTTPPPTRPSRGHGAAVAATMVSIPVTPPPVGVAARTPAPAGFDPSMQPTPPPVVVAGAVTAGVAHGATEDGQGAAFRETLWFKKGDVEQMVADAKAKAAERDRAPEAPADEGRPLDQRYTDDGSLTVEDRQKFSLRSGASSHGRMPVVGGRVPGERMSDAEVLREIGGGKKLKIAVIALIGAAAIVAVVFVFFKSKPGEKPAPAPASAPAAAAPPAPAAEPAEPPPAPKAAPAAAPAEAAAAPAAAESPAKEPAAEKPAGGRARAAHKKAGKKAGRKHR